MVIIVHYFAPKDPLLKTRFHGVEKKNIQEVEFLLCSIRDTYEIAEEGIKIRIVKQFWTKEILRRNAGKRRKRS